MELIVYTAVFGNTDPLHEPKLSATAGARFVCFTDQPLASERWEVARMPEQAAPTRAGRLLKACPHALFPDADAWLWIDASVTLYASLPALLGQYLGPITTFRHRDRTRIADEAREIARAGKARALDVFRQLAAYQHEGFDTAAAPMRELSCGNAILRRNTPQVRAFNELLARQLEQFTLRDQMAMDYCAWKLGLRLDRFEGVHSANPHMVHRNFVRPVNDY